MRKEVIGCFILFLFVISFVGAEVTPIQIKTIPYHEVQISPYRADTASFSIIEQFIGTSNQYGDVYWDFDTNEDEFNLVVFVKTLAHERITSKKYKEEYEVGEDIYIELASKNFEFIYAPEDLVTGEGNMGGVNASEDVVEEPLEEVGEEELEAEESSTTITGGAVGAVKGLLNMKTLFWVLGGVVALIILFIVVWLISRKRKGGGNREIKVKKLSELKAERQDEAKESDELRAAEVELKKAQARIAALKNKDKIDDLQKELEQKQKEIMALRGSDPDVM